MTDQRELDRLMGAFFADGADELADRVIEAALDQIDHTRQRRAMRLPRRLQAMPMITRLAAAAAIGAVAVGGAFFLLKPGQQGVVGGPGPTTGPTASPSAPTPTRAPVNTPDVAPTQVALYGVIGDGRQIHTSTSLADGRVLVAGGYGLGDVMLDSAALYDPGTGRFSPTGPLTTARGTFASTLLANGQVLVTGGGPTAWAHPGVPFLTSAELFDPGTGTFANTGAMATPLEDHTATLLPNGKVLITGGNSSNGVAVASAELYDPASGTFSPTGSMATARGYHTATLLADGRVLVIGGSADAWTNNAPLIASAEIYDPKAGTFSTTGPLNDARAWHTATLLADGRVLVTGGQDTSGQLASAEVFDPKTGRFTRTGPMGNVREYHTATLLADGRVLVAGGGGDYTNLNFLASAEIYDPKTGTFTATGSMADARTYHGASLLPDGRVLVTGGYGAKAPLASAELFDPKAGTFSPAGTGN